MPRVLEKYNMKDLGSARAIQTLIQENENLKNTIPKAHISTTSTQLTDSADGMTIENVKIKGATSQAILPTGYIQIDYIESTGTQYIDTNYTPVQGDSFEFKNVSFTPNSNVQALFSAGTGDYQLIFLAAIDNIYFKYFSTGSATTIPVSTFNNANIKINNNGEVYINDVLKATANYDGAVNTSLNLFRRASNFDYTNAKIGEIIISNNNIIKKHYIPAQRNSDNAVGLYEIVGNTFYNNGGTGTFSIGNEVPNPSYPQDIHRVTGNCNEKVFNQNLFNPNNIIQQVGCTINNDEITITDSSGWGQSYIICGEKLYAGKYTCSVYGNSGTVQLVIRGYKNGAIYEQKLSNYYTYVPYYKASSNGSYGIFNDKLQFTLPNDCDYYYVCISLARNGTETIKIKVEKGTNDNPTYTPHAEQNAPLTLGNTELYEDDEIEIDFVQKAGYKKVVGANLVQNNAKIASYNGETITTEYKSTTGQLTTGATVVYKLATPVTTPITDQTLLAQLEKLINMKTYKEITNIELTGEDLAPILDCDYYQDMSTLNDRLDTLEARIELLEN